LPAATAPWPRATACVPSVWAPENAPVDPASSTAVSWRWAAPGALARAASTACWAERPPAIRSSTAGPRRGSVTFWLAAAPAPARAWAHRAATAGLDEVTAVPTIPVRSQRPTSEKVTRGRPG
jgi:hypothetical protein